MSKLSDKKSKALGSIAAVQTLLERYPTLTTTDSMLTNFSVNTSVGFMMDLLSILGVTQTDLINWVANLLAAGDDAKNGFLIAVENAVKAILLANIKDMWTCSVNPLLPDSLMKYSNPVFPKEGGGTETRPDPCTALINQQHPELYRKIEIDLNQIDMFGILNYCPSDVNGSIFYFDAFDSILDNEDTDDPSKSPSFKGSYSSFDKIPEGTTFSNGDIIKITHGIDKFYVYDGTNWNPYVPQAAYGPNDLWKSCDFNAFLWYIINKGTLANLYDLQYSCWDNRVRNIKALKNNQSLRETFFDPEKCQTIQDGTITTVAEDKTIKITGGGESIQKQQIILCEFEERPTPSASEGSLPSSNILRVWLNANRYYHTEKITAPDPIHEGETTLLEFNKTIFEFNYDYIYSLKLFDTKTIIASIINSLLGISASVSASVSVETKMIEAKVSEIVKKVIEADDQSTSDCYYTFSNEEYDKLLKESKEKYNGVYSTSSIDGRMVEVDSQAIIDSIRNIKQTGSLKEQVYSVSKTLEEITSTVSEPVSEDLQVKFNFGLNFIKDFIQQTVTQIVLHVLSPKVAILYAINSQIMGGDAEGMFVLKSWEDFLRNFQNVLFKIIKQIKDILVEELYKFVMDQLKPLLELMIAKIALETVQYYRDLIEQLIGQCIPNIMIPGVNSSPTTIENVNYADIVEPQTEPEEVNKKQC